MGLRHQLLLFLAFGLVAGACGGDDTPSSDDATAVDASEAVDDGEPSEDADEDGAGTTTAPTDGLAPPTTRGPAPTLDVDPVTGVGSVTVISGEPAYRGLLGQLDADRNIVQAAALPPADAASGVAPLTGMPLDDPALAERPAIVAKLDNTEKGRPQEALTQADIVFVTEIEGGFTRLAAVFHSRTPAEIGPVRSGRTTDIAVFESFNTPIFVWSGANRVHKALLRSYDMVNLGAATRSEYTRAADRPGTYDLMTDPTVLWDIAAELEEGGAPPPHFEYRDETTALPVSAVPATAIAVDYASVTMSYAWDASLGLYRRSQDGTPHVDADDLEVRPANVVVAEVARIGTGMTDTAGSPVTEQQFVGTGRGWVFTDGHAVEVVWTKPSLSSVPTWTTPDGVPVPLTPGQTWVELAPAGATTFG